MSSKRKKALTEPVATSPKATGFAANATSRVNSLGVATKRQKTGGRVSKPLDQKIAEGNARSVISGWNDDTTLDSELTALYLCISTAKLEELRGQWNKASGGQGAAGPAIIKIFDKGATGQNQPVLYKLRALREFQQKMTATDSFNAAVNAGLAAWVTMERPYFAEPEQSTVPARLVADAWDLADTQREQNFEALLQGRLRVTWLTANFAAKEIWTSHASHSALAARVIRSLHEEHVLITSAVARTVLASEMSTSDLPATNEDRRL